MEVEQRKSLQVIAREIIERRAATFTRPLDPDALRFAEDSAIEALHTNDAYVQWYGRARIAEEQLKAVLGGTAEKVLADQLAEAHATIKRQRDQLVKLHQAIRNKTPLEHTPAKPHPPVAPKIGALLLALFLAAPSPVLADVRDPVTAVCPEGTIKRQDFAGFKTDSQGRMLMDEVGRMSIHIDVWCRPIMPAIKELPPVEVRHEQ